MFDISNVLGLDGVAGYVVDPGDLLGKRAAGRNAEVATDQLSENAGNLQSNYDKVTGLANDYNNFIQGMYGDSPEQYKTALSNYMDKVNQGYDYGKDVKDFYSPAAAMRVQKAMDAVTNSQANAGGMFSSDYLKQLAGEQQALASEEWDKAFNRMNADRAFDLQKYNTTTNNLGSLAGMLGNDMGNYANAYGSYVGNLIDASNALTQGMNDINSNKAQILANKKTSIL